MYVRSVLGKQEKGIMGVNGGWNMRDGNGPFRGPPERESIESHIMIDQATMGLGRNLVPGKPL